MKAVLIGGALLGAVVWGGYVYVASKARGINSIPAVGIRLDRDEKSPINSETRKLEKFSGINVSGAFEIVYGKGDQFAIEIEGPAESIKKVKTEIQDSVLVVNMKESSWNERNITLRITGPDLETIGGSGHLKIT